MGNHNQRRAIRLIVAAFAVPILAFLPGCSGTGANGSLGSNSAPPPPVLRWVASSGSFYISDTTNQVVRSVSGGVISTFGGNHTLGRGYSGDAAAATAAQLSEPASVTMDSVGNLMITDQTNQVIRMIPQVSGTYYGVAMTAGNIYTVAGNHALGHGYSGDGGAATSAKLYFPIGITVDSSSNLYIADTINNVVRKVDTIGNISTVAGNHGLGAGYSGDGGAATSAQLRYPAGVAADSSGNVYIAEKNNNVIRKVDATTGNISTVAGNQGLGQGYSGDGAVATSAQLRFPMDVAVDSSGSLVVADTANNVVRIVPHSSGTYFGIVMTAGNIYTVAGNNALGQGYSGDGAAAINAQLKQPNAVSIDSTGQIYISDRGNMVIRKVDLTGNISTVAGNNGLGAGFSGDGAAATSAQINNPFEDYD